MHIKLFAAWLVFAAGCGVAAAAPSGPLHGTVVHVADGDSFVVRAVAAHGIARRTRVRITAIDAPEATQAHHRAAGERLRALILKRVIRVDTVARDRYGRSVGRVTVDGRDAGLAMLRSGLAWYAPAHALELEPGDRQRYREAERSAQRERAGLWIDANPTPPWTFRRAHPRSRLRRAIRAAARARRRA